MIENKSFVFGIAVDEYNFTGREGEIRRLAANFEGGINTILISPRRWGKTSLVKHVILNLDRERVMPVYLDMFACKSEYEFYNALGAAVLRQTATQRDLWLEEAKNFLVRLSPKITVHAEQNYDISVSLGITPKTHSPEEILGWAEEIAIRKNKRIVICIDEFQQIGEMSDSVTVQKRLRSVWQHQHHVSYCLFGSKQHLMNNIFQSRRMPFYQFGDMMYLKHIDIDSWCKYICSHFEDFGRHIPEGLARDICTKVELYSSYVQQLAWFVFIQVREGETATQEHLQAAFTDLLNINEPLFMQQIAPLTSYQMNFLRAVCAGYHDGFNTSHVRSEFDLGSASNIPRLKSALTEYDLIEINGKQVFITDPVFASWLKTRM